MKLFNALNELVMGMYPTVLKMLNKGHEVKVCGISAPPLHSTAPA